MRWDVIRLLIMGACWIFFFGGEGIAVWGGERREGAAQGSAASLQSWV